MRGSTGGQGVWTPLENYKKYRVSLAILVPTLKNHKAIKPAFDDVPSSAGQPNSILWRLTDGPLKVIFETSIIN